MTIATYSAIDRLGSRLISPLSYAAILWVTAAIVLLVWVRYVAGGDLLANVSRGSAMAVERQSTNAPAAILSGSLRLILFTPAPP